MKWDYEFDVVVVGSGNGALTSAICSHDGGAKTLVIEKAINTEAHLQLLEAEFGFQIIDMPKQRMLMIQIKMHETISIASLLRA